MERRLARRPEEEGGAEEARLISGEPGEAEKKLSGWQHLGEESGGGEICTEAGQSYQSQLKKPVKPVEAKT